MIGNNSCGLHSIVHGTTRDHTISVRAILSDASMADFGPLKPDELQQKLGLDGLEGTLYREVFDLLNNPENYRVKEIPYGCCGMAGSFGYEKEHFELSMKAGELVLFPEVHEASKETLIAAPGKAAGTRCMTEQEKQPCIRLRYYTMH